MIGWTAVIPFKGRAARKTRMAPIFSAEQRDCFSHTMFHHLCAVLAGCDLVEEIAVLSDMRPPVWKGRFICDEGRGLNAELTSLATNPSIGPMLIIHADLALLQPLDIAVLLKEADRTSMAIASDHNGTGTNAIALVEPAGFAFHFGPGSLARHIKAGQGKASIVRRMGLSLDIDTPEDYNQTCRHNAQISDWMTP